MNKLFLVLGLMVGSAAFAADAKFELKGDAAKGEVKFKQLCVSCHGEKGDGTGAAAAALKPPPTNFTDAANSERLKDEYVYKVIKEGGQANGRSPLMVAWNGVLKDDEIRDVAAYVLKFKPAPAKADPKAKPAPAGKTPPPAKK
jgi:cytochrome c oxidase cbb3-type subunit 3